MADMSINPIGATLQAPATTSAVSSKPVQTVDKQIQSTDAAAENAKKEAAKKAETQAREETATKEYGPVISRSSDGDTVRIKNPDEKDSSQDQNKIYENSQIQSQDAAKEAIKQQLQNFELPEAEPKYEAPKPEYKPFEFPDEVKDQSADNAAKAQESSDKTSVQVSSMKSASDAELRKMYLQGDITSNTYNQEVEARQSREEALKAVEAQFSRDMTGNAAQETENERSAEAIEALGSEDASESIPIEVRAQFVQNMDNM